MNGMALTLTAWGIASCTSLVPAQALQGQASPLLSVVRSPAFQDEHAHMNERGAAGMGFSQTATAHQFLIQSNGGVILVEAKDPRDTAARDSIRLHLQHITKAFANADFDIPMFVHGGVPPGVPDMKALRHKITYSFQETPSGGQVVIRTSNRRALAAVHEFLKYQIAEHQTGDATDGPGNR
jgi:hypothetical protein